MTKNCELPYLGGYFLSHTMWCFYLGRPCVLQSPWDPLMGWTFHNTYLCKALNFRVKNFRIELWIAMMSKLLSYNGVLRIIGLCRFDKTKAPHSWWKQQCATKMNVKFGKSLPFNFTHNYSIDIQVKILGFNLALYLHFCIGDCWCNT